MSRCRVYVAVGMSGRDAKDIVAEERAAAVALRSCGIEPLDPAKEEGVKPTDGRIQAETGLLRKYWRRDKELIRRAHVVLDLSGPLKSEGVAHEIAYARFFLWKPVVRVWPGLGPSIARLEDDVIVANVGQAAWAIRLYWGTPLKRLWWRIKLYARCRIKAAYYELKELYNAVY